MAGLGEARLGIMSEFKQARGAAWAVVVVAVEGKGSFKVPLE